MLFVLGRDYGSLSLKLVSILFFLKCAMSVDVEQIHSSENICKNIECEPLTHECPSGSIRLKAGYHGCCDACIKKSDLQSQSACQKMKDIREKNFKEIDKYVGNLWIPECADNGDYKLRQTKAKKTVCMNNDGTKIFGQDVSEKSQNMSCECSHHIFNRKIKEEDTFMIKPEEHCTATGDYEKLQCIDNLCYCANTKTGEVEGRIVQMDHIDKLSCYDKENPITSYLKSCEKELVRARKLHYQFLLKGIKVLGLETVDCDPDGTFSPTQCDSSRSDTKTKDWKRISLRCFGIKGNLLTFKLTAHPLLRKACSCTSEEGVQIRSYFTEDIFRYFQMGCDCARDNEKAAMYAQYPALKCDKYGNYNFTQCVRHGKCFCVDEDGDVISKELNVKDHSICKKLLDKLLEKNQNEVTTITTNPTSATEDDYSEEYEN